MLLQVCILQKIEFVPEIISRMMDAGIRGTTVIDCSGSLSIALDSTIDPPPIFASLRQFLNPSAYSEHKMLLTVLDEASAPVARRVIHEVVDLAQPNTGILFTIPILDTEGLAKEK